MPIEIIVASRNLHKIKEFQEMGNSDFPGFILRPIPLDCDVTWEETGDTFEANALIKAKALSKIFPTKWVLADDSGLCVEALSGAPGVYSARYAGENATDAENRQRLLRALESSNDRKAHFHCTLIFMRGSEKHTFEGKCVGKIAAAERGQQGFGYDSVFVPEGYGQTFAELSSEVKNQISHRALALKALSRACAAFL